MAYIYDNQAKLNYNGKFFYFPLVLLAVLGNLKRLNEKLFDDVILITGDVGTAKSTMAQGLAGVWEMLHNRELSLEQFTWDSQGVVDFIEAENNDTQSIIFDEAIKGGTGRDVITKVGNMLKVSLVVGRRKRHFYLFLVDELQEFSKKIISRANLLIDMRTMQVKGEKTRGYFKIYSRKELQDIYWLLKTQRIKYISQYNGRLKPFYKFRDFTNVFVDEKEYDDKKVEETRQQEENGKIMWSQDKIKTFHYWSQGMKHKDISDITNVTVGTIKGWSANEFKKVARK